MRYLVFIFKGFNTRTINVYHGKIMNSKGIQNQVQNKVLPGRRALTARGAHRSRPFRVGARASVWACVPAPVHTCGSLCVFRCVHVHTHWGCQAGGLSGACPSGTLLPQGCTLSVLFLLLFCVPTSGFLKPLLWHMGHVQFFTPLIMLKGTFTHLNLYLG